MRKRTRFVPGLVLGASFAAVVPACGGSVTNGDGGPADAQNDMYLPGVAAVAYCCFDASGVADVAFAKDSSDGG